MNTEMDANLEKKIAKAFIYKNKQERFLFERSKKNRTDVIHKLPAIIDESLFMMKSTTFPSPEEIIKIMKSYSGGDNCYVISEYEDFDGVCISLQSAVEKLQWNGFPSLIVGLPSGFSHFKNESYASNQPNCFLKPKIRFDGAVWNI